MPKVSITATFVEGLKSLPLDREKGARNAVDRFITGPARAGLRFRPLEGSEDCYIIDARHGDRVILRKIGDDEYVALDVGPHDNVYRRWNRKR